MIWRWLWRFVAVASALTLVLAVVAGVVLVHVHLKPAPWVGMTVVLVAGVMAAGGLFPAMQSDMRKQFARAKGEEGGAEGPGSDGPA